MIKEIKMLNETKKNIEKYLISDFKKKYESKNYIDFKFLKKKLLIINNK